MSDLVSSVPGIFSALLGLVTAAGLQQSPPVTTFPLELGQYEPGSYNMVTSVENHRFEWAAIGSFAQEEFYDVCGITTVYSGAALADDPSVALGVLNDTYALFNACVMTPAMSNRTVPILGAAQAGLPDYAVYLMLPGYARYKGQPGNMGGAQSGWSGVLDWSFSFSARLVPA